MKYFFVLNPGSAGGKSRRHFSAVLEAARQRRVTFDFEICRSLDQACDLSRKANLSGYDVVVAVGGDGTINSVLNGFYDEKGKRISEASLGVLHTGTSPDFCRSYAIPCQLDSALELLFSGCAKKILVGKITLAKLRDPAFDGRPISGDASFHTRYFACCANIGLGASVARYANNGIRKWLGDSPGTLVSIAKSLARFEQTSFSVVSDGKAQTLRRLVNLAVGRTFHVASGIKVRSELKEDDRRFYCLAIHDLRLVDVAPCLVSLYSGKELRNARYARLGYCSSIHVLGNSLHPEVECDGDPQGFLPCLIETAADRLDVIGRPS
jgi:diacylglycerol kinase family enzyme